MTARRAAAKRPHHNLRTPGSSFVGRAAETAQIATWFDETRLVTLLGPGGMGKTRLALRYAASRVPSLGRPGRGGVWFVDLSEAKTLVEVLTTVAVTLHIPLLGRATERAMFEQLGREIGNLGPTLVVLDNVERLAAPLARVLEHWLDLAPSARWLVTSRIVLGLPAERTLAVGPLEPHDARALFLERASHVRELRASDSDPAVLSDIVDAVDRMPLAIELAASRTRVFSMGELRRRLAHTIEILSGGSTERHASIRRVVLDSVALLPPPVRRAFVLASVLRNGFTVDVAESVLGAAALSRSEVLAALDTLARGSLLRVEHDDDGGPARYRFFETIREVAEELAAEEVARGAVRAEHARHYARFAATVHAARDDDALTLLERDLENLLAAAATSTELARSQGAPERARDALTILLAIEPILSRRGLSSMREHLFAEGLATLTQAAEPTLGLRAEVLLARGLARRELGDVDGAAEDVEAALPCCEPSGDPGLGALALVRLGGIHDLRGDTARARERFDEALELLATSRRGPLRALREAEALLRLGHAHRREGSLDQALAATLGAARRYRARGRDEGLASSLYELGVIEMFRGRSESAFAHLDEGLAVARRGGVPVLEGACLTARGCLLQDLGRLDEALDHHARAASIFRDRDNSLREASALHYLATTYLERGEPSEAVSLLEQARSRLESIGTPRYDVLTSGALAVALAALGRHEESGLELDRATRALRGVPDEPALVTVLAVHRGTMAAWGGGTGSPLTMGAARELVLASPSDDTRFALRQLERKLQPAVAPANEVLRVWGAGEAFAPPGGSRVELPPRSPLRRILAHLVAQREAAPGEPVGVDEIIRVGWPGEKVGADAALNRAYVALATLRKRGLRSALVSGGGGYALSRAVRVERLQLPPTGGME